MKKLLLLFISVGLLSLACQNNQQKTTEKTPPQKQVLQSAKWLLNGKASTIEWTGYKTTGKIPVKGVFKSFKIENVPPATDLKTALEQAKAEIDVTSIFSNNEGRDKKLVEQLFDKMLQTQKIEASIKKIDVANQTAMVNIKMNGQEKTVPMKLHIDENKGQVELAGQIDLIKDFKAGTVLENFHKACFDKHTGPDGISKTWSTVDVKAHLVFQKK